MSKKIEIKWVRSAIGYPRYARENIRALGLKRLNQVKAVPDNPAIRGMIRKVQHLIVVNEESSHG